MVQFFFTHTIFFYCGKNGVCCFVTHTHISFTISLDLDMQTTLCTAIMATTAFTIMGMHMFYRYLDTRAREETAHHMIQLLKTQPPQTDAEVAVYGHVASLHLC